MCRFLIEIWRRNKEEVEEHHLEEEEVGKEESNLTYKGSIFGVLNRIKC